MEMSSVQVAKLCEIVIKADRRQLVTKLLRKYVPDEEAVRPVIARMIMSGDIMALHAIGKCHRKYLMYYEGRLLTMWVIAGNSVVTSQWRQLMTFVTDEDLLNAQAVGETADAEGSGLQYLLLDQLQTDYTVSPEDVRPDYHTISPEDVSPDYHTISPEDVSPNYYVI